MIEDPVFYALAIPALFLTGISKGGFGSGLGIVAVPMMALVIPVTQAAAVMLPILCLMDVFGVLGYRKSWDRANMRIMVPGAVLGIGLGTVTFGVLDEGWVRLLIGLIAVVFTAQRLLGLFPKDAAPGPNVAKGMFWSAMSGFTSFVAHAGGPPLSVYLLPQRLDKTVFAGTTVLFFAFVNYAKLIPYAGLGQFSGENLATALVLAPIAPIGIWAGMWLHKHINATLFFRVCYVLLFFTGLKLLYDGATAVL